MQKRKEEKRKRENRKNMGVSSTTLFEKDIVELC